MLSILLLKEIISSNYYYKTWVYQFTGIDFILYSASVFGSLRHGAVGPLLSRLVKLI